MHFTGFGLQGHVLADKGTQPRPALHTPPVPSTTQLESEALTTPVTHSVSQLHCSDCKATCVGFLSRGGANSSCLQDRRWFCKLEQGTAPPPPSPRVRLLPSHSKWETLEQAPWLLVVQQQKRLSGPRGSIPELRDQQEAYLAITEMYI